MKTNLRVTLALAFYLLLFRPAVLDAQSRSPAGSGVAGGPTQACEAPRVAFQHALACADSIFAGVGWQAAISRDGRLAATVERVPVAYSPTEVHPISLGGGLRDSTD